jgi:hypothetical protein
MSIPWWVKYDWSEEFGITDPRERAAFLADMFGDDREECERLAVEIEADILRMGNRLN